MLNLAEREEGRLKMEIKRLNQEKDELKERRNNFEVSVAPPSKRSTHCQKEITMYNLLICRMTFIATSGRRRN